MNTTTINASIVVADRHALKGDARAAVLNATAVFVGMVVADNGVADDDIAKVVQGNTAAVRRGAVAVKG
ncbi:hypothetical protein HC776_01710 [bacterium]|nr:hypothetical protein [bacterium]